MVEKDFHIEVQNATIRQYHTKVVRMKQLATAACARDEMISEIANARLESGSVTVGTKQLSDSEDEHAHNKVEYSYIEKHADY